MIAEGGRFFKQFTASHFLDSKILDQVCMVLDKSDPKGENYSQSLKEKLFEDVLQDTH
jgi:hypothetical protein